MTHQERLEDLLEKNKSLVDLCRNILEELEEWAGLETIERYEFELDQLESDWNVEDGE